MARKDNFSENFKSKFDYDVAAIGAYTDEQQMNIWNKLQKGSNLMANFNMQSGIKSTSQVKLADFNAVVIQDATTCARTPDGGVIFTDDTISVAPFKVEEAYCNKELNGHWTQMYNRLGANIENLENPFEDVIIASKTKTLLNTLQRVCILGDTASADANLSKFDGILKTVTAAAAATNIPTGADDLATVEALAESIPEELFANGERVEIWCSRAKAKSILKLLASTYNYDGVYPSQRDELTNALMFELPTEGVMVRSIPEMTGSDYEDNFYAIPYTYVVRGTDGESDEEQFTMEYQPAFKQVDLLVEFKFGLKCIELGYFRKSITV